MQDLTRLQEGIKMHRFETIAKQYYSGRVTCHDAALALGMNERHFYRLRKRYEEEGLSGIQDKRIGKSGSNTLSPSPGTRFTSQSSWMP